MPGQPWTNQIERVWSTLKQSLYKYWTASCSKKWVRILKTLTRNYNESVHHSIAATPIKAKSFSPETLAKKLRHNAVKPDNYHQRIVYKVGDKVRIWIDDTGSKLERSKQYYSSKKGEYTVESILAVKTVKSKKMYLVKWSGYPIEEATWEPASNLNNAKMILEATLSRWTNKSGKAAVLSSFWQIWLYSWSKHEGDWD